MDFRIKKQQIMDKRINIAISQYIELIRKEYSGIEKAILFGSYAKNAESMESDIDLAIVFDKLSDEEKFDIQVQLMMLASQIDYRIEPHPFSKEEFYSDNPFTAEIKRTGIELSFKGSEHN